VIIIPAIDILNGQCVRLLRGEYDSAGVVAADPIETAVSFSKAGAEALHLVDLNGAKEGALVNGELICEIAKASGLTVEVGGGIRNMKSVEYYVKNGVSRIIIGSAALKAPEFVKEAVKEFPGMINVGIDAKGGFVSTEGWTETSDVSYLDFALMMQDIGVSGIIFTEIERDGALCGINAELYASFADKLSIPLTASGGIRDIDDIKALTKTKVYGAICGKSIYSGTLDLAEAISVSKEGRV